MRLLISLFVAFSCSVAVAKTTKKTVTKEVTVAEDGQTVVAGESEENRLNKQYQVTAIIEGVGPNLSVERGIQAGYYLDHNSLVLVELMGGANQPYSSGDNTYGNSYNINTKAIGVAYKHFLGNSFYVQGGVDYLNVDYKYDYVGTSTAHIAFQGNAFALNVQIGNQWHWDNFTLGCDWVGYTQPFGKNISSESLTTGGYSWAPTQQSDDEDSFLTKGHLNLLRFYMGASF